MLVLVRTLDLLKYRCFKILVQTPFPDHCSSDAIAGSREVGHFQARALRDGGNVDILRALDGAERASSKISGHNSGLAGAKFLSFSLLFENSSPNIFIKLKKCPLTLSI